MRKDCCIVIPIYKYISYYGHLSISNVVYLFGNKYDIYILYADTNDINDYKTYYPTIKFKCMDKWENSYNKMCLQKSFYNEFSEYKYMLISDPDTFIFNPQFIEYWVSKEFDYIGSMEYTDKWIYRGDLSFRNINAFINALEQESPNFDQSEDEFFSNSPYIKKPTLKQYELFSLNNKFISNDENNMLYRYNIHHEIMSVIHFSNINDENIDYNDYVKNILSKIINYAITLEDDIKHIPSKDCCIVIPVYNPNPTLFEELSIRNVIKKFGQKYDISIIYSEYCDITYYTKIFDTNYIRISGKVWDNTARSYNNMCVMWEFYDIFKDYEYILISQTDSFIFNDDLDYWLDTKYDYIGGFSYLHNNIVWTKTMKNDIGNLIKPLISRKDTYSINGGLCVRNIHKFKTISKILGLMYKYIPSEDLIFSTINMVTGLNLLNICPINKASYFSNDYDKLPDECIENIFGCHYVLKCFKVAEDLKAPYLLPFDQIILEKDIITQLNNLYMKLGRFLIK